MTGVVLCGGQSTRMGRDKGLLLSGGRTWCEHGFYLLSSLTIPVVVSVNSQQQEIYSSLLSPEHLIADDTKLQIGGPLLGLLSVYDRVKDDLLLLACDMQKMQIGILKELLERHINSNHEAYVYATGDQLQPLCAIYTCAAIDKIYTLYHQQQLERHSMLYVLDCLSKQVINIPESLWPCFSNYNSPEDLLQD
jgi:molybdopterin-guanine dinucleotide biosynthesis protein A